MDRRNFIRSSITATSFAALHPASALAQATQLEDLAIIEQALALHPGLYRYQTPHQFAQRFATFAQQWKVQPSIEARFLLLSRLTAQVRCGHTHCNPYNQSDAVVAALFNRPTGVPFTFRWIDRQMAVTGDSGAATGIAKGSIVERLNGVTPAHVLAALVPFARADGGNEGKRIAQMEMRGTDRFETFDIFQGLLFPPSADGHRVQWRDPSGKRHAALLPAVRLAQRQALAPPGDGETPIWDWTLRGDGIVVLTMPTWVTYRGKWDWQGWLEDRLTSLNGTRGLIIDLRDNEGGTDCGDAILERLADRRLRPLRYMQLVKYRDTPTALNPYLDTWDPSFRAIGKDAVPFAGGFYRLAGNEQSDIVPRPPRIAAPVAALIGPVNSSATFSFARRAEETGLVRLFGETTGGSLRGINGGAYFFVRLPESGLEFDVPLKGYYPERTQPDRGLKPDDFAPPSPSDIASGRDRAMERATGWIMAQ